MIESLTPEQEAAIPGHVAKWQKIAFSTERVDPEKAKEAVKLMYQCADLKPPKDFMFFDGPRDGLREAKKHGADIFSASFGSQDASWLSFYDFFQEHFGIVPKIRGLVETAKTCGWIWTFDELAIITDRPTEIKFDDSGLLHNEKGPSITYKDGLEVYSWHGTRIPGKWIKEGISASEAITWSNIEQRRAACEILGWAKVLDELGAKVIDKDVDPEIGTLLEVDLPDIGKERFIRVQCGTKREFALPVPPTLKTALGAQAWMVGLEEADFDSPEFRT